MILLPSGVSAPVMNALSRRSLLRASPALLGSGLLTSTALASSTETPVLRLFREWDELQAEMLGCSEDDVDALCTTSSSLERRIVAEPSTGPLDLAAKVVASSCYGDFPVEPEVIRESERLLGVSRPVSTTADVVSVTWVDDEPSPVMALYRQHQAVLVRYEGTSDEDGEAIYYEMRALEIRMAELPARSAADLAAKVLVLTQPQHSPDTAEGPALVAECEALVAEALA